jgi:membrane-bound lytic murein transglycosylase B
VITPPRRRARGVVLVLLLLAGALVAGVVVLLRGEAPEPGPDDAALRPADVARGTPVAPIAPLDPATDVVAWAAGTAARTGVPARALQAYAAAELAQRVDSPGCRLSWATLAGIGRVESQHGGLGRARLDADGVPRPRIVGVPLDGSAGVREVRDTDGGALDGDTVLDRAVGPMQFLPSTWARFGADGDGDGVADPHQIDDAARGAAAYLCAGGRDTADGEGWWSAVLAYNRSGEYARLVWAAVSRYTSAANL